MLGRGLLPRCAGYTSTTRPTHGRGYGMQHATKRSATRLALPPLGIGLQVVRAVFVLELLLAYVNAAILNPSQFDYDLSLFRSVFGAISSMLSVWFITRRAAFGKPFIVVTAFLTCIFMLVDDLYLGAGVEVATAIGVIPSLSILLIQMLVYVSIVSYVAVSSRVATVLTVRLRSVTEVERFLRATVPVRHRMRKWPFWRDLAIYFVAFSFLGHWAEMLFCQLIAAGVFMGDYDLSNAMLWGQWLYPFSAEGIAIALVVVVLHPFKEWLMKRFDNRVAIALPLSFLLIALSCTAIDFTTGITANADYHLWDYRNMPFNFMGQICLQNSLVYSIAATFIVWVVYPLMDKGMSRLPRWLADMLFWVLLSAYGFLALLHFMYLGPSGWVFG